MLWYFDTSAVNALCDDIECDVLVAGLLAAGRARTSSFAAFEVAATKNAERRLRLLRTLAKITECSQPFEEPGAFVKRHLNTLASHEHGVSLAVTSFDTSWNAIRWPERVTDEKAATAANFLRITGDWFDRIAVKTRSDVQRILKDEPSTRLRTVRDTLRYLMAPGRLFESFIDRSYLSATGQTPSASLRAALPSDALVRLYFGMFAYALHHRSVRESHFSRHRHAGGVDLAQAVYLPMVDRFITNDQAQFRALRVLRCVAGTRRGEVQRYTTFRARLLAFT